MFFLPLCAALGDAWRLEEWVRMATERHEEELFLSSLTVCCSQLAQTLESLWFSSLPGSQVVTSRWCLEISPGENVYIIEVGKYYKSSFIFPLERVVQHLSACFSSYCITPGVSVSRLRCDAALPTTTHPLPHSLQSSALSFAGQLARGCYEAPSRL